MTTPFITPQLFDDIRQELIGTYSNSGVEDRQLSPEEVIRRALVEIAIQLRMDADEQKGCNKVDECTASALVRHGLADWLSGQTGAENTGRHADGRRGES